MTLQELRNRFKAAGQCLRGRSVLVGWQIHDYPSSGAIVVDRAGRVVVGPAVLTPKHSTPYIAHNDIIGPDADNVVEMNPAARFGYGR